MSAFQWDGTKVSLLKTEICANKTDHGYKQTLQSLLEQLGSMDRFEHFSCSYVNAEFTLIPALLFSTAKAESLLQFSVSKDLPKGETDYSRLPEWNMVVIYHLPLWIKSVLIMKIPRIVIQHELAHVLRHLHTGSTIPLRSHIIVQEELFSIVIRKDGNIVHTSIQEYQSAEDIVYQLLICYQRLNIQDKSEIYLHGSTTQINDILQKTIEIAGMIESFGHHRFHATSETFEHLQFQTLCV